MYVTGKTQVEHKSDAGQKRETGLTFLKVPLLKGVSRKWEQSEW